MTEASRREEIVSRLRQERDEIRLKMHLAKAEIRDEWETLEGKWEHLEDRLASVAGETREAGKGVGTAFGIVADELGEAYRRIRSKLS